jgi:UDP-GlcNAc3NAcA epimerase
MKITTVIGARPQFIKAAPVSRALARVGLTERVIHTGQHYDADMSDIFFAELSVPAPAHQLGIHGGSHGAMTGRMLVGIEQVLLRERSDLVLVYGDTNSTMAGALAAVKLHIPVAHVEAGLRSFNRAMPEEINRVVTDHVSALLFCPTRHSVEQLAREGIANGVHHVGDVMYDAIVAFCDVAQRRSSVLPRLALTHGNYSVATIHRAENTDDPERLARCLRLLREEATQPVVLPIHPRTRQAVERHGLDLDGLRAIEPLGYLDMIALVGGCAGVYTDSGGLQKEAYFLRKPCVTMRDETEWVETVSHGWNRLWTQAGGLPRRPIDDFGDGHASEAIAGVLTTFAGRK